MQKNFLTTTGWEKRIAEHCLMHGIDRSKGQVQRMALKIAKRFQHMTGQRFATESEEFYAGLRILGIHKDETAQKAILGEAAA